MAIINGTPGNDTLNGGLGADKMVGALGNDTYYVDNEGDLVIEKENEGIDTVISSVNFAANTTGLRFSLENITLVGSAYSALGSELNNTILGNATGNALFGMAGNDTIRGGDGNDVIYGGYGFYSNLPISSDHDKLYGDAGNDTLYGESGNDILDGGTGADLMDGGAGNDTYYIDNVTDKVVESANSGTDTVITSVYFNGLENQAIENFTLIGSALSLDGSHLANIINGNALNNVLNGWDGNDTINGAAGNDTLTGHSGNDVLDGGDGDDLLIGGSRTVSYSLDNDLLYGGAGNDRLEGYSGNDVLDGGTGADTMFGGLGDDTYIVDNVNDVVIEAASHTGVDRVFSSVSFTGNTEALIDSLEGIFLTGTAYSANGSNLNNEMAGNDVANVLIGLAGADIMEGHGGNDIMYGDNAYLGTPVNGNDRLWGNEGNDTLYGEGGNDWVSGGTGTDTLSGGTGADRFIFDSFGVGAGVDKITDFNKSAGDILDLSDIFSGNWDVQSAINDFVFARNSGANTVISVDLDGRSGAGAAVDIVVLNNINNVSVSNWYASGTLDVTVG